MRKNKRRETLDKGMTALVVGFEDFVSGEHGASPLAPFLSIPCECAFSIEDVRPMLITYPHDARPESSVSERIGEVAEVSDQKKSKAGRKEDPDEK